MACDGTPKDAGKAGRLPRLFPDTSPLAIRVSAAYLADAVQPPRSGGSGARRPAPVPAKAGTDGAGILRCGQRTASLCAVFDG
jgi:hypothetical protein